jgi:tripartite-type tricarboxylate transporter receptor subunit TctC
MRTNTCLLAALLALTSPLSFAQAWPSKPVRFVLPYAPGGVADAMARTLTTRLPDILGQPFVIDNRPGAGGVVAAEHVAKSAPDGYTFFVADTGQYAVNPGLYAKLSYDPQKDFAPVMLGVSSPLFIAVGANVPANSLAQLLALSKEPKPIMYGSVGNGSIHHLAMENLKLITRVPMTHVPYKGVAQSIPAVLAGDVEAIISGLPALQSHAKAGKLKIIAVAARERTPLAPEVASVGEAGYPDYDIDVTIGLLAPAGTDRDIIRRMNEESVRILRAPESVQRLNNLGIVVVASTPAQFAEAMLRERQKYGAIVKASGAKVD